MTHRFYVNDLGDSEHVHLAPDTVHHLRVLGLSEGSEVALFDGTGLELLARIESISRTDARVCVLRRTRLSREAAVVSLITRRSVVRDKKGSGTFCL
jgi:16S rRNA U1498 N3-methylase RsmE